MDTLGDLSDEELLARLRGHVGKGNVWCAKLIAYLVEVDERRIDRIHGCSSMWDFCTRKLGMSEGEAHRRIAAARTVRRFPQVFGYIARGDLHLCALYALRKHLTSDNVDELLREATGKSTREVEKIVAVRFPRPDAPSCIEPVTPQALLAPVAPVSSASPVPPASPVSVAMPSPVPGVAPLSDAAHAWSLSLASSPAPGRRPRVEPLSASRYRIELTVSAATKETLDRIKDLMLHRNPSGDLETILDASLALLLARLEKERLGKTPRPGGRRRKPADATDACSETKTHDQNGLARVEPTAGDPNAHLRSEPSTHDIDGLARVEPTASSPDAPMRSEPSTHDPNGLARVEPTAADPPAHLRSKPAIHDRGARVHAAAPGGNQRVSARRPANGERADVDAGLGVEVAPAARHTSLEPSTPATRASRPGSRYVPTKLRREVFARDGEQCSYVGPDGDRCPARGYLELDHIRPKAHGGTEIAANLRVRCRAHNALYAEQVFGRAHVAGRMHLRHRNYVPPTPASFETVARGLRSLGFREPEARRALETLATERDMETAPVETILREALLVLT